MKYFIFLILGNLLFSLLQGQPTESLPGSTGDLPGVSIEILSIVNITDVSAIVMSKFEGTGNKSIKTGIFYGTTPSSVSSPNYSLKKNIVDSNQYSCLLINLKPSTIYYIRAFAMNNTNGKIANGKMMSFKTGDINYHQPVVNSQMTISNVIDTAVTLSANVNLDKTNPKPTSIGFCYSTSPAPTIESSVITIQNIKSAYDVRLTGLLKHTRYYVRSFATNDAGTSYGDETLFTTNGTVTDIDGNVYNTLIYGNQEWLGQNLKVVHFNNGDVIQELQNSSNPDTTSPGYYYYDNDSSYNSIYGKLYNASTIHDKRNPCPKSWHIPSGKEWKILQTFMTATYTECNEVLKAKRLWEMQSQNITNLSGFSLLPGGFLSSGEYIKIHRIAMLWSTDVINSYSNFQTYRNTFFSITTTTNEIHSGPNQFKPLPVNAAYCRCLKD